MTKAEVVIGQMVRTVVDRWDAPVGTIAKVDTVGGTWDRWCFTVRWSTQRPRHHRPYSPNLFEEDLLHFELFAGPVPSEAFPQKPPRVTAARKEHPFQLPLPFGGEGLDVRT